MSRIKSLANPLLLGFDATETMLSQIARTNDGYPPYNIEILRRAEPDEADLLRITLAVAGFSQEELDVSVDANQLVIRGRQAERPEGDFLFRGIAARQFQRVFVLADGMDVLKARLHNGLLAIDLIRPEASQVVRKINISTSK
ncbi:Hsp20 family protein [Agrobacterium sp. a22-2]|uniref:Hsp20 family protein n=1 Tax=Agrobacterium sp. a22-2 TaxID=2283840 RepID=UPI0014452227|nr:Hsp20 family protein [Agrobacterium sp. a22-2]NKN35065.1 Hsp20 family protein [Agrobacterium sp. a22-2]